MKIEKSIDVAGIWNATCRLNGEFMVACSENKSEAMDKLFEKIYWLMDLEKPVAPIQYP